MSKILHVQLFPNEMPFPLIQFQFSLFITVLKHCIKKEKNIYPEICYSSTHLPLNIINAPFLSIYISSGLEFQYSMNIS